MGIATSIDDLVMLTSLMLTALAILYLKNLLTVVLLGGIYSLLSAGLFVDLDAVDVALTEAAVGAALTTIMMLATLAITGHKHIASQRGKLLPIIVTLITTAALIYATFDMPPFGDPSAPIHHYVAPHYLHQSSDEIGIPNVVTSVLASYRGYDTLGEVTVVFTAAIGVLLLIGKSNKDKQ